MHSHNILDLLCARTNDVIIKTRFVVIVLALLRALSILVNAVQSVKCSAIKVI